MTWMTWRQFRTQAWVTGGALAVFAVALVLSGLSIGRAYQSAGVATCGTACDAAVTAFLRSAAGGFNGAVHDLAGLAAYALPVVVGVFWGAPAVSRELESGTYRVAWNQSVTRRGWLAAKLTVLGLASATAVGLLTWWVTWWAGRVDAVDTGRVVPEVFSVRGVVPVAYALFAFALGVTLGMLVRRPLPAMAATLGVYGALLFAVMQWVRPHLVAPVSVTRPLDVDQLQGIAINDAGNLTVVAGTEDIHGWVLSSDVVTSTGQAFSAAPGTHECGRETTFQACTQWLQSQDLQRAVTYHPESHFWPLQWVESGIFVGIAVLLVAFCFWRLRRTS